MKTAFCLFEHSKVFANLLRDSGYNVVSVDLKLGIDIMEFDYKQYSNVEIIIAHPPCTEFAVSGARWWADKPKELLQQAIALVNKTLEIIDYHKPKVFFIENPIGRISKCVPRLNQLDKYIFNPYDFAGYSDDSEAYSKKTVLYGKFNNPIKKPLPNLLGSKMHDLWKLGLKKEELQEQRSLTPIGFAKAFVKSNVNTQIITQQKLNF